MANDAGPYPELSLADCLLGQSPILETSRQMMKSQKLIRCYMTSPPKRTHIHTSLSSAGYYA